MIAVGNQRQTQHEQNGGDGAKQDKGFAPAETAVTAVGQTAEQRQQE